MKILFIRFGKAGDLIVLTPILEVLKKNKIKVSFLMSKKFYEILEGNPSIEKFFFIEDNFFENIKKLRKEKFDIVFDFNKKILSTLYSILLLPAKIKRPRKNSIRRKLAVLFKIKPKGFHFSEIFFESIKKNLRINGELPMPFLYNEKEYKGLPENYAVFFPGGFFEKRKWPIDFYEKLGEMLNEKLNIKLVILGDEKDKEEKGFENKIFIDLRGKTSWKETFYIVKNSNFVVSNDTVGVQIAEAYKKPVFAIYGPTLPEFGFKPRGNGVVFEKFLKCRPCSIHGEGKCKFDKKCLKEIKPEEVFKKIIEYLSKKS
ncbi:MAG: glycosyltransferase family 9 protein [candidate division WOR-3 bacterium]